MITENKDLGMQLGGLTTPNFIYNRFDLQDVPCEFVTSILCENENDEYIIQARFNKNSVELGLWLAEIPEEIVAEITDYIFHNYQSIKTVEYKNSLCKYGDSVISNHFRIVLPHTIDELKMRLSSKGRYNIKREKRILEESFENLFVEEFSVSDFPSFVFEDYFRMKKTTHGTDYGMSACEYIRKYHVTDIYCLMANNKPISIILSCEQCPIVYIENLTYDIEYAKYSPGQVLYDKYLERLIEKGFKEVYLAGGDLEYKKRYGSIEESVFTGVIYKNNYTKAIIRMKSQFKTKLVFVYNHMPERSKNLYRKLKKLG